ncbi:fatty acid-binding protein-like [Artemia franciscana]|uniref:Cytosolic fatty-acid binding proteins domain-containing protein n=1 Tax=Artemia franciscana TaxID=6661 RepID=A0AA88L2F2_ARTSF|nr:hypothetical protein QYM36_008570 [Artemia franciscana]
MAVTGKFKLVSSENFDEYMKAIGVGFATRKIANSLSPTVEISVNEEGEYTLKTSSTFKTSEIKFKLGEEFDEERQDGKKVKSTVTKEGNKLTHVMKADDKPSTITREVNGDEMKTILTVDDVVCTRLYKRVD